MTSTSRFVIACLVSSTLACPPPALATDVSGRPLRPDLQAKPNVILGIDDSSSMDDEVSLRTADGSFWWDNNARSGWGIDPLHPFAPLRAVSTPWFNISGIADTRWRQFTYLFPNGLGTANGLRLNGDAHVTTFAVMPTTQFAFLRSPAYNPLYYNPAITYQPWAAGQTASSWMTFGNANPQATRSHPLLPTTGAWTVDLRNTLPLNTTDNFVFTAMPGMTIPANSQKQVCDGFTSNCGAWVSVSGAEVVPADTAVHVAMAYRPATYWMKESCTPEGRDVIADTCTRAPDGSTLRRYEIVSGRTFPSGRSYTDELQNFANWFQYYRKRSLMLAASMGQVMASLQDMRVGTVLFNHLADATMLDTDVADNTANGRRIAGMLYEMQVRGNTPTRAVLNNIGQQFSRSGIVTSACQRNNAFVVTDGYSDLTTPALPPWDAGKSAATWGSGLPYQTTYANSLADFALRYYTNNPRPDLARGAVRPTQRDLNVDLHVNTYALSMTARGTIFDAENSPTPTTPGGWPEPLLARNPVAIDDLWHATINGRGRMYLADDTQQTTQRVMAGFQDMLGGAAAQSPIAVSSVNLQRGDGRAYRATYDPATWSGDVTASTIDITTGAVDTSTLWSLSQTLAAADWRSRVIASYNGSAGTPFTLAGLGSAMPGATQALIDYLHGSLAGEGTTLRKRVSLVGGTVNARPVVSTLNKVVFAATGEGMLHAIDSATGQELWGYVPGAVLGQLPASTQQQWPFHSLLDGSPVLVTKDSVERLYAGLGTAGAGFYALDVSQPRGLSETSLATRVLWEFPNASTPAAVRAQVGLSMGRPVAATTRDYGDVVLVSSGYNAPARDGKGRVFMLDARSGALLKVYEADGGVSGIDPGLAQLSAMTEDDGHVRYVYGGDERGNLWRIDIEAAGTAAIRIAELHTASGVAQPVTTAPELVRIGNANVVLVGTGRLLGSSDYGSQATQSFYAIKDDGSALGDVHNNGKLTVRRLVTDTSGKTTLAGDDFTWQSSRGWLFDLPVGMAVNTDPVVSFGTVSFVANQAELASCQTASALFAADVQTGHNPSGRESAMDPVSKQLSSGVVVLAVATSRNSGVGTVGDMTTSDNRVVRKDLQTLSTVPPRKNAWRQVNRQ